MAFKEKLEARELYEFVIQFNLCCLDWKLDLQTKSWFTNKNVIYNKYMKWLIELTNMITKKPTYALDVLFKDVVIYLKPKITLQCISVHFSECWWVRYRRLFYSYWKQVNCALDYCSLSVCQKSNHKALTQKGKGSKSKFQIFVHFR